MKAAARARSHMLASASAVLVLATTLASAHAELVKPRGSLRLTGDLTVNGPSPHNRIGGDAIVYFGQRAGIFAGVQHVAVKPFADVGQATVGIAYRAAAARPKLDLVVHADAGVTWPVAPAAGGGVITYFWPLKKVPVAVTSGLNVYLVVDGVDDTRVVVSVGLGLAVAR